MNKKVFVKNKSKEIQEKLFEIGFGWGGSTKRASYLTKPFLFIYEDMTLTYDDDVDYFYEHNYKEISAEDILNIKVEHLPKTWEEFCKNNPVIVGEATLNSCNGAVVSLPAKNTRHSILRRGESDLIIVQDNNRFLSFPTRELAEEFATNFKDLIEEAGDLI